MIWYRRIAQFVLTNKRSIFCDALKLSPISAESITKIVDDNCINDRTKTENLQYQMLVRGNIQVLQVTSPDLNAKAGCCILVEAGAEDSPDEYLGLPHLLEHLVVNSCYDLCPTAAYSETHRFQTVYQFEAPTKKIAEAIKTYATVLFGAPKFKKSYAIKLIDEERRKLDNEFHEKRAIITRGVGPFEIIKSPPVGLHVMKFASGTETTLKRDDNDNDLINKLDEFRKLYRQRRVAICIYSPEILGMETIMNLLNVGDFLEPKSNATTAPLRSVYERRNDDKDISKSLIVLKSEYDTRLLTLIFPIMDKLDIQKSNTIDHILEMIMCKTKGFLIECLRNSNLATKCAAISIAQNIIIEVNLTEEGLKQIQYVNNSILNFLQFLHDKWETDVQKYVDRMKENALRRFYSLSNFEKAQFIATHLDGSSKEYDEMDLYKDLGVEEAKKLISRHLLKNENTVHMIYDHNPTEMLDHVGQTAEPCTEPIYGREFYFVESTVFEPRINDPEAGLIQFYCRTFENVTSKIKMYKTPIIEPKDTAFQKLFAVHFKFYFDAYDYFLSPTYTKQLPHSFQHLVRNDAEFHYYKREWFTSEPEFSLAKEYHLAELSLQMSKSRTLAESLMAVIVNNWSGSSKMDPLPLQYDTLLNMDHKAYCRYLRGIKEKPEAIPRSETITSKYVEMELHSINRNEGITATLVFYKTSQLFSQINLRPRRGDMRFFKSAFWEEAFKMRREHAIYTLTCKPHQYNDVYGFLCQILSVESKQGQDFKSIDVICQNILKGVEKRIKRIKDHERRSHLQEMFNSMKQTYVRVQVVGHKEPMINAKETFKEQFESWFKVYQENFNSIRNLEGEEEEKKKKKKKKKK